MGHDDGPAWSFLTNYAQVLLCIAEDPGVRLREIGERVGITERAAHRIVTELAAAGYVSRTRSGRRNRYTVHSHLPLPDPLAREGKVGDLVAILARRDEPMLGTGGGPGADRPDARRSTN
jgi:MarR family